VSESHRKLIATAAELARGPNLDERFDLEDRLPRWITANIDKICDRQRDLAIAIKVNADKLQQRIRVLEDVVAAAEKLDCGHHRVLKK
jgi:hypothetical protein